MIHLGLGDHDQAFEWLTEASKDHSEWFAHLQIDPRLEPLRRTPLRRPVTPAPGSAARVMAGAAAGVAVG